MRLFAAASASLNVFGAPAKVAADADKQRPKPLGSDISKESGSKIRGDPVLMAAITGSGFRLCLIGRGCPRLVCRIRWSRLRKARHD